jgi:hypothetical protein
VARLVIAERTRAYLGHFDMLEITVDGNPSQWKVDTPFT